MTKKRFLIINAILVFILAGELLILRKISPYGLVKVYRAVESEVIDAEPSDALIDYSMPVNLEDKYLRELVKLKKATDFQTGIEVARWTRKKLKFDKGHTPKDSVTEIKWDPNEVLADKSGRYICDTYARIFAVAVQHLGITGRVFWIDGHVVPEIYDTGLEKWVMIDPTWGYYYVDEEGILMSVVEIIDAYGGEEYFKPVVFGRRSPTALLYGRDVTPEETRTVYTNSFTLILDGAATCYDSKVVLLSEQRLAEALQYVEDDFKPLGCRAGYIRILIYFTLSDGIIINIIAIKKGIGGKRATNGS